MSARVPIGDLVGKRLLLADGSTGTALEALSPEAAGAGRVPLLPIENLSLVESLHEAYFAAGSDMVETATFSASAEDLAHFADGREAAAELSYRVNRAAAEAARRAADKAEAADGRQRYVAGSIGPGDAPPSLGAATFGQLFDSYLPQARGLADGGADLAYVETCQDPLQIKAAAAALKSPEGGRGLPFVVSATVDANGRLLAGTDLRALVAIVAPLRPLAIGLNCSGGPDELEAPLAELSSFCPLPVSFMPNAGLPCSVCGTLSYPFGPEEFSSKVEGLARRLNVAIAGGCCGSGPGHMKALHEKLSDRPRLAPRPEHAPALSSLYQARPFSGSLFKIGERANSAGSAAFAALLDAQDFEGMADRALAQEMSGAAAIDLHVSRPGRDESEDLVRLTSLLAPRARAALSLDSNDPEVIARALPLVGGRALINSTNLEDPERARKTFELAARFGAAVVCLAMDENGPARSVEEKTRICRALYEMATGEFGLPPDALLFDPLTFAVAAGEDPVPTLEAIPAIKRACPGSLTVLGVGNVSFGLPRVLRPAVTSGFIALAVKAGLDAAIVDTAGIPAFDQIPEKLGRAVMRVLGQKAEPQDPEGDPMDIILGFKDALGGAKPAAPVSEQNARAAPATDAEALAWALERGDGAAAEAKARSIIRDSGVPALSALVSASMAKAGKLWNEGSLSLPLVLRTAEAAKKALKPAIEAGSGQDRGTLVMATVKGDLHDIGKNIVAAILACSGWKVVDLGTNVATDRIVEAARAERAVAVGLSGLLTRSLSEMKRVCAALSEAEYSGLALCGGAAVDPSFVEREIEPEMPGHVRACRDAFDAGKAIEAFISDSAEGMGPGSVARASTSGKTEPERVSLIERRRASLEPPFIGSSGALDIQWKELSPLLDEKALFGARWGYKRKDYPAAEKELERLLPAAVAAGTAKAVYGYFPCKRESEDLLSVGGGSDSAISVLRLPFPALASAGGMRLADYFDDEGDFIPFFAVTAGRGIADAARARREAGALEEYWHLHGLGSALAEAAAEWIHARIGREARSGGADGAGNRYSFGYPGCPGLDFQKPLLDLLGAERIGLGVTEGFQLNPEHSVTAFVVPRSDAKYFGR